MTAVASGDEEEGHLGEEEEEGHLGEEEEEGRRGRLPGRRRRVLHGR